MSPLIAAVPGPTLDVIKGWFFSTDPKEDRDLWAFSQVGLPGGLPVNQGGGGSSKRSQ